MAEYRGIDSFDYILLLVKWKKFFIIMAILIIVVSYLAIYYFVPNQYDSISLIIPTQENQTTGISAILKNFTDLPFNMGNFSQNVDVGMYNTVIYSRSNLEKVIKKFDLYEEYNLGSMEKTVKLLEDNITTDITEQGAFTITVRASSPQKSADMNNYIIDILNKAIITLNVSKARDNRQFLENRYTEVKNNLALAEDSLKLFQEKTGMFEAEDQVKAIIEEYASMEADLAKQQVELAVVEKLTGKNSPQSEQERAIVENFQNKMESIKNGNSDVREMFSLRSLPKNAIQYFRYYRNVKIYDTVLEYLIPMYEQTKFDEQKDVPILQVIDYAVPPEKRAYPKRIIFAAIITFFILSLSALFIITREILINTQNPKIKMILNELKIHKKVE